MVIDIKMCRFDNVPWGFRLVGGSDFEFPLTVVKVTEGSIAEEAGLRAGDVIVRVNDTATSPLTHDEVNHIIRHCGNVFYLGVQRETEDESTEEQARHFPILGTQNPRSTPDSFIFDANSTCKSPAQELTTTESATKLSEERDDDYLPIEPEPSERSNSVLSENTERKLVEEEIAAVLSGESEVLKDHKVMGIFPKPGVCMSSDVLRSLNEEAIKTKAEKEKENRKWTTFLQKPNRPIPKSKAQLEAERRAANAYKVKIGKTASRQEILDKKWKDAEKIIPEPAAVPESSKTANDAIETEKSEKETAEAIEKKDESPIPEPPTPTDSEVPSLEETPNEITGVTKAEIDSETTAEINENLIETTENEIEQNDKPEHVENSNGQASSAPAAETASAPKVVKTEEELALERQLADVQRQLVALSSLPSTIQSTLDAVTKQLADILPAFKLQQQKVEITRSLQLEQINESNGEECAFEGEEAAKEIINEEDKNNSQKDVESIKESESTSLDDNSSNITAIEQICNDANDQEIEALNASPKSESTAQMQRMTNNHDGGGVEDEQQFKKQKRHEVIEELEEHLDRKKNPKGSKRAFGPLTPSSERPVVLPGGRRWYRPKDAYNDEIIAEILSSQAELITGHTLGVNFMKYQKPEKKIDLNRSEVYKIIHHLDRKPVRGIEIRPSLVAAESDIRNAVQS